MARLPRTLLIKTAICSVLFGLPTSSWGAEPLRSSDQKPVAYGHGRVTIYRDSKGVPHIDGASSAAVMYGLGYTLAQDRLAELEQNRRRNQGRRAEILGRASLKSDIEARDRQITPSELKRMYAAEPAEHQAMMQAFVDGINKYIAEVAEDPDHKTPYEFGRWGIKPTPWTLLDFLGVVTPPHNKSYELENLTFLNAMVTRYGPKVGREIFDDVVPISDPDSPTTIPKGEDLAPVQPIPKGAPIPDGSVGDAERAYHEDPVAETVSGASRCMVIGPEKSASGHPLMMEATSDGPEMDLHGGGFDTAGFSHSGWGLPLMGRSLEHGWLMTSGHADTHDMYAEKLNPADQYQYWFKGAWKKMDHRSETIKVKGGEPVVHEVAWTIHGPILKWDLSHGVAYSERSAEQGHELDNWVGLTEMARAKNLADFQAKGVAPMAWSLGVCYADVQGQIGFWEAGRMPIRPSNVDSRLPMPGTGEYEWTGFYGFNEHPHMLNPKQGYIHTWNSKATSWSREGDDARVGATFRTWLGAKLAAASSGVTLLDLRDFNKEIWNAWGSRDRTQTSPDFFAPYIRAAVAKSTDPEVKEAAALMLAFNGQFEDLNEDGKYDDPGGTLWHKWLEIAPDLVFTPDIGDWWEKIDANRYHKYQTSLLYRAIEGKDAGLPLKFDYFHGRDRDAVIIQSIRKTIDALRPEFANLAMKDWRQPIYWKYLDASKRTPDKPGLPHDEVITRTFAQLGLGPSVIRHQGGEGWSIAMELNPKDSSIYTVVEAGGQSLFIDPAGKGNPHLNDQLMMHTNSDYKKIDMNIDQVKRKAESTTKLDY